MLIKIVTFNKFVIGTNNEIYLSLPLLLGRLIGRSGIKNDVPYLDLNSDGKP